MEWYGPSNVELKEDNTLLNDKDVTEMLNYYEGEKRANNVFLVDFVWATWTFQTIFPLSPDIQKLCVKNLVDL